MTILDEIYSTYLRVRDSLSVFENNEVAESDIPFERMSELNDYAYFIILFGQLEIFVNEEYEQTVGQIDDTAFAHRVNMLPERSIEEREEIMVYWEVRCEFAHGYADTGRLRGHVEIPIVYERIKAIMMP